MEINHEHYCLAEESPGGLERRREVAKMVSLAERSGNSEAAQSLQKELDDHQFECKECGIQKRKRYAYNL